MRYALIKDGTVAAIVYCSESDAANHIAAGQVLVASESAESGYAYDGSTFTPPGPPPPVRSIPTVELLERFTENELIELYTQAGTTPRAAITRDKLLLQITTNLGHPRTNAIFGTLVSLGVITAGRRNAILS